MLIEGYIVVNNQVSINQANTGNEMVKAASGQAEAAQRQLEAATGSSADFLKGEGRNLDFDLGFSFNSAANVLVVRVIDPNTGKVIRQIPPEDILCLAIRLHEMLGQALDKKA